MWFYCKYCVGTGGYRLKSKVKHCGECSATGIVSERRWHSQEYTAEGAGNYIAGFGPVPTHVAKFRLTATSKTTRITSTILHLGLRMTLKATTSWFNLSSPSYERNKENVR